MKFPGEWAVVRLEDVVTDMQPGFAQAPREGSAGTGQVRTHNVTADGELSLADLKYVSPSDNEAAKYLLKNGDVIFNNTNSEDWVGKTALFDIDEPLLFSNHMTRLRVNTELMVPAFLGRYLHFLWMTGFSRTRAKRWVSQAAVDQRELSTYSVPLPSILEQQRIVEILEQADALRNEQREIVGGIKQLSAALFLEIFGDPEEWRSQKVKLGDISTFVTSGSRDWSKYYSLSDTDAKFIRVQNIKEGELDLSDMAYVRPPGNTEAERARVQPGDLLISITGTVGQVAVAPADIGQAYISQHVALVRTDDTLPVEYLVEFLNHPAGGQLQIQRANYGQTKPGLNLQQIRNLWVPRFDPKKISRAVAARDQIASLKHDIEVTTSSLEQLQLSLLHQAFLGDVTARWREAHRAESDKWLREHAEHATKKTARIAATEIAPPERTGPSRHARRWLMDQLSRVQGLVYRALEEWKGTLIPAEDLGRFLEQWPIEHLEDANDQVRRALNQLAGLGMIARVSIPNQRGEYVSGYRVLRNDELTKFADLDRLGAPA